MSVDGGASSNHIMFGGGIGVFLYQMAGLDTRHHLDALGPVHFRLEHTHAHRVKSARVSLMTLSGLASLHWNFNEADHTQSFIDGEVPLVGVMLTMPRPLGSWKLVDKLSHATVWPSPADAHGVSLVSERDELLTFSVTTSQLKLRFVEH